MINNYVKPSSENLAAINKRKRAYNQKRSIKEYSEQNNLFKKILDNKIPIKLTSCMKDYSVFYQTKYKFNKEKKSRERLAEISK